MRRGRAWASPYRRHRRPTLTAPYHDEVDWQVVLDVIDAVESWIAGQSWWIQVPVLLSVLLPLCWVLAQLIDRVVEFILAWHTRRDPALQASRVAGSEPAPTASAPGRSGPETTVPSAVEPRG